MIKKYLNLSIVLVLTSFFLVCGCSIKDNQSNAALNRLVDESGILATMYQYSYGLDERDPDMLADAFTEDGLLELWAFEAKKPLYSLKGKKAIHDTHVERFKEPGFATHNTSYAQTTTVFVEITDTTARCKTKFNGTHYFINERQLKLLATGWYDDILHKTDKGWKIYSRKGYLDRHFP